MLATLISFDFQYFPMFNPKKKRFTKLMCFSFLKVSNIRTRRFMEINPSLFCNLNNELISERHSTHGFEQFSCFVTFPLDRVVQSRLMTRSATYMSLFMVLNRTRFLIVAMVEVRLSFCPSCFFD